MLITTRHVDLVNKLVALAGGDIDLVQAARIAAANGRKVADLEKLVDAIVQQRRTQSGPFAATFS
jgi:hypothetical protein